MESTAHFYNPKDDTLDERIRAYKEAFLAWQNVEASLRFHDQQGWEDRLGSKEDLLIAKEITENSLSKAVSGLSHSEMKLAVDKQLISSQESEYLLSQQKELNKFKDNKEDIIKARKKEIGDISKKSSHEKSKSNDFDKS